MLAILRAVTDRLKTLFVADAALDLESRFVARHIERKAELLRQADRYAEEGLDDLANELRDKAEQLTTDRPLATALPTVVHLADAATDTDTDTDPPRLPQPAVSANGPNGSSKTRKKKAARGRR